MDKNSVGGYYENDTNSGMFTFDMLAALALSMV